MVAIQSTSEPKAHDTLSASRGPDATPSRSSIAHTRATLTPPKTAAETLVSTTTPAIANGTRSTERRGGNGEYQPPSARGTSSSHGIGSVRCSRPAAKAWAMGQWESRSVCPWPTTR